MKTIKRLLQQLNNLAQPKKLKLIPIPVRANNNR